LGEHGLVVKVPLARLTTEDGATGFGFCWTTPEQAGQLLGAYFGDLFSNEHGVSPLARFFEYPLWDLAGQRSSQPVYALAAATAGRVVEEPYNVPCYDTSLYFDDLHLASETEAAQLIAAEAREGYERGHRAFKIKVGRGARHLPLEEGTRRDIAIVRAVRQAVGRDLPLMLDANNGYNLNLAKRVLLETADCNIFWLEEAFHEDRILYLDLQEWLQGQRLAILIADGEGDASPHLLAWAQEGVVNVIQYDIFSHGFSNWLQTSRQLDDWGVRSAPHHYGRHYGNYVACHLAGAIKNFSFVEWDEATTPGLDASGYVIREGRVFVPQAPGFGLKLDDTAFRQAIKREGFVITL
jgi:L-alanine-DL-glutamate epimerase-like enolase superfamily enzyme